MQRSRTYFPENCNAVRETAGRRGVRERASAVDPARLPNRGTVPDGVLPSPERCCGARRRGHLRAQQDRRPTASVGLLEVLRPDAPRWASVASQARASRVLRAAASRLPRASAAADLPAEGNASGRVQPQTVHLTGELTPPARNGHIRRLLDGPGRGRIVGEKGMWW
jgi:hypothetical protein